MNIEQNKKDLKKIVRNIRIVWCFTIVLAIVFLALGISSLVQAGPFLEKEAEALVPHNGAIALTVIGGICAVITLFLTMFGFVMPAMAKFAPKITGVMLDTNKENFKTVIRTVKEAATTEPSVDESGEWMYCHACGQKIAKDSVYCKHCGAKQ